MQTQSSTNTERAPVELFLRIQHPSCDPDDITSALGIEPEHVIKAGVEKERDGVRKLHAQSYWLAALPVPDVADMQEGLQSATLHEEFGPMTRDDLPLLRGATEYDIYILMWLKRLEAHRAFLQTLSKDGGAVTFLVERDSASTPLALKTSLGRLAEFGFAVELN